MTKPGGTSTSLTRPTPTRRAAEDTQLLALLLLEAFELGVDALFTFREGKIGVACRGEDMVGDMNRGVALMLADFSFCGVPLRACGIFEPANLVFLMLLALAVISVSG